jgi:aarF domain-containing kinase
MEFIHGHTISDVEAMKKDNISIKEVDNKLVTMFGEQIFHTGFVHADPHHGNIFVRRKARSGEAEIVLIDHGLYDSINESDRQNLCKLWKYIILKDDAKMRFYSKKLNVEGSGSIFLFSLFFLPF